MVQQYILKLNLLIGTSANDLHTQNFVEDTIVDTTKTLSKNCNCEINCVSTEIIEIDDSCVFGRCVNCGEWVSDSRLSDCVREFSNGAMINGKWYCDICLPDDHPNHF